MSLQTLVAVAEIVSASLVALTLIVHKIKTGVLKLDCLKQSGVSTAILSYFFAGISSYM
jgi:hypothetical protein